MNKKTVPALLFCSCCFLTYAQEDKKDDSDLIPNQTDLEGVRDKNTQSPADIEKKQQEEKQKQADDDAKKHQAELQKKIDEQKKEDEKRKADEKELQLKVNSAADKAIAWLKSQQQSDGSFTGKAQIVSQMKRATTSTVLYALLKSGVPINDPAIVKGYSWLRNNAFVLANNEKTSTVSAITLALDAFVDITLAKSKNKKSGDRSHVIDTMWISTMHKWLLDNRRRYQSNVVLDIKNSGSKKSTPTTLSNIYCTAWPFPLGYGDWDNADTALAVLTFEGCSRNGVRTGRDVWFEVINHFLVQQQKVDKKPDEVVARGWSLISKEVKKNVFDGLQMLGFMDTSNMPDLTEPYPGSTEAGLESLVISRYELRKDKDYKGGYSETVEKSIRDGLEYLSQNWPIGKTDNHLEECTYYLTMYGLERVGILGKIKYIGGHDWYIEGAKDLVKRQNPAGYWGKNASSQSSNPLTGQVPNPIEAMSDPITDTSFALLFLKKATFEMPKESPPIVPEAVPNVSTDVQTEYSGQKPVDNKTKADSGNKK